MTPSQDHSQRPHSALFIIKIPPNSHFDAKVSSEYCCDYLNVYVDDVLVIQRVRSDAWTSYSINLTQGEHKIRWSYMKDDSSYRGSDAAWIDNISIQ